MDFLVGIALRVVRGFLNGLIKDFTSDDIKKAISDNTDLWSVTPDDVKSKGTKIKGKFTGLFQKYEQYITTELILEWIRQDHVDLHDEILKTNNGYVWFDNQVKKIKKEIGGM